MGKNDGLCSDIFIFRHFQIYPLWRAFLKSTVFGDQKRWFTVDGWPNRGKKMRFQIWPKLKQFSFVKVNKGC